MKRRKGLSTDFSVGQFGCDEDVGRCCKDSVCSDEVAAEVVEGSCKGAVAAEFEVGGCDGDDRAA